MGFDIASNNPFPSVLVTETAEASVSSPAAGKRRVFVDTDHVLKLKDSGGTVVTIPANPMTTLDDIIIAGASGVPARLAKGSNGQVLTVNGSGHLAWATPVTTTVANDTIFDAKGDLVAGTGADASARLAVGSNDQVLTADSTQTTGMKWAAAAGGGAALTVEEADGSPTDSAITKIIFPNETLSIASHIATVLTPVGGPLQTVDATLSGDVTMTTANTFYDGPSASFTAGTWLIWYKVLVTENDTQSHEITTKLWDGTTVYDESEHDQSSTSLATGYMFEASGFAKVVLSTTTTLKVSVTDIRNGSVMKRDVITNSASSHQGTRMSAVLLNAPNGSGVFSGARVRNASAHTITNNSLTKPTFDTEDYDTDAYHSTSSNTSRITIPFTGKYGIGYTGYWSNSSGGAERDIMIQKNGTSGATNSLGGSTNANQNVNIHQSAYVEVDCVAGDYFEIEVYHDSGSNLNLNKLTVFAARVIGAASGNRTSDSAYASAPSGPMTGDLWMPSDGYHDYLRWNGTVWVPYINGIAGTLPSDTGFSWVNQGSSTEDVTGAAHILTTVSGDSGSLHGRVKTAPSTPYTITAAFRGRAPGAGYPGFGLWHRESSSGKLYLMWVFQDGAGGTGLTVRADYWTDTSTFSTSFNGETYMGNHDVWWFQIKDDGTDRKYLWSADGRNFYQVYSVARTTNMTANQVGWFDRPHSSFDHTITLLSWTES